MVLKNRLVLSLAIGLATLGCGREIESRVSVATQEDVIAPSVRESEPAVLASALQTEEQVQTTLKSFRKLDDHPLFEMTFYGEYVADEPRDVSAQIPNSGTQWACSIFVSYGKDGKGIYGRNFDWHDNPALLLHTNPKNGYASISMVDISYLGFEKEDEKYDSLEGRKGLLNAPRLPFDGMNEHGLVVGMAAVGDTVVPHDPGKPSIGSLQVIRLMLDRAKTVEEALEVFQQYNILSTGGPNIHYLIADARGRSALIELKDGKTNIIYGERNWQSATNFYQTGEKEPLLQCHRFAKIHQLMTDCDGGLTIDSTFGLLNQVAQANTRWSAVYDLEKRAGHVAMSGNIDNRHDFQIDSAKRPSFQESGK